ncbi:hypothetical protein CASFOL_005467 [Castilleja foliolosa]|uniref:Peptidase A1 domain-containing protein n=1 Tax=Castilleja foliolosa TaxID=1961234 RepID=A0ABD3E4K7_9LAMI
MVKGEAIRSHFHSVKVTSLLPASTCSRPASTGSNRMKYSTTLEVVHMLGPCSPNHEHTKNKPSLPDILSHDQSKLDSIQAQSKQIFLRNNKVMLPTQFGLSLNIPAYVVTIGLGTPPQNVTLIIDSGSDVTWTQCHPCLKCYNQRDPVIQNALSPVTSYPASEVGAPTQDTMPMVRTLMEWYFVFGCGQFNEGLFGETSGILGLARTSFEMSFLDQTAQKYERYFSYCFPSTVSSTGHLIFGRKKSKYSTKNVKFIPLIPDPTFYRVEIVAISIGRTRLSIHPSVFQNPGTIIDSGAVITHLPQEAYVKLRNALKDMMGSSYPTAPAYLNMDTCYYINNHTNVQYPFVSFTFGGGVEVQLHPSGIVAAVSSTMVCLAFTGNTDPNKHTVFGNMQQRTFEMVYDVARERLGFGQGGCE